MRLVRILGSFRCLAWPERIRQLIDSENALAAMSAPLHLGHRRQQAELIRFNCLLSAAVSELALGTVSVEHEVGWRRTGQQRGYLLDMFLNLARESRHLYRQRGAEVAVNDPTESYLTSKNFGQHARIECQ